MENRNIIKFSKFIENNFNKKTSFSEEKNVFENKTENSKDDFLVNTVDEIEKKEKLVKPDPSFDPPVKPEQFIIDEEEPDELDLEDSLHSYQNKNNFNKVKEEIDNYYPVFKDKSENFSCNLMIEGAKLNDTKARLILESDDWVLMFDGDIDTNGKCVIPIRKLNILDEGTVGRIRLEVIAENTVFTPWEDEFKVKMNKKVMVQVNESKYRPNKKFTDESNVRVNVRK